MTEITGSMPMGAPKEQDSVARFAVGTIFQGDDHKVYQYVQAEEAITAGMFVYINENYDVYKLTKTAADKGYTIGVALHNFTADYYGVVAIEGDVSALALKSCAPFAALYTSGTAGYVDDESSGQTEIGQLVALSTATSTGTGGTVTVRLNRPQADTF